MNLTTSIGNSAGKVWKYLDTNGASSANKIANGTHLSKNDVQRAIGWLAREEKISIEQQGRTEILTLVE
jgi:predicted RNA-binding protein (virulence factor B family)